ncbi:MAG: FHA domain-containing protein [Betaproteobacteria bacterium]|nr:FHA domain-containing protein [Betaproteobacteria bacterium]
MAKLTLSLDGMLLKEFSLVKERTTIGRKPGNDIQIDNLAISGEHAVILSILNDVFLEDLDSTNGTNVNGQPVKKHLLQNGDVIELGKYRLKFIAEAKQQIAQEDFEKTMIIRPEAMRKPVEKTDEQAAPGQAPAAPPAAPAAPAPSAAAIQVLTGASAGKQMDLVKTLSTLGKPGVQVAVIARRPHGYFITHVEGAVFPSINGRQLDAQAHPLNDHDIIELAGVKMEFFFKI